MDTPEIVASKNWERWYLVILVILAVINGLLYVFLVPPWQHYDEQNHFEFVWLAAHLDHLPKPGDYDADFSRQVVESMIANQFFDDERSARTGLLTGEKVVIPGISQLDEQPLYYLLASLPLRVIDDSQGAAQFYAARLVSLLLYLITIFIAWAAVREVTALGSALRWLAPLTLVFLPSFTDLMTAVNNDVGAVCAASLFVWFSFRLIRRGFSIPDFFLLLAAAVLSFFMKSTAMVAIALLPIVLLFAILRGKWRWAAWALLIGGILAAVFLSVQWDDAALWYRATAQESAIRQPRADTIVGEYVLQLDAKAVYTPDWLFPLFQPIPLEQSRQLAGKPVTLGVWIWASQPMQIAMPSLRTDGQAFSQNVEVGTEPAFYALQAVLPEDTVRAWVVLKPGSPGSMPDAQIYLDGLVLAEGTRPIEQPPRFDTLFGESGTWGGEAFVNLLRNGSLETPGPRIRPEVSKIGSRFLADHMQPSMIITSWLDPAGAGYLYRAVGERLFRTFWATFGWGNVPLVGSRPYQFLLVLTALGLFGCCLGIVRRWPRLPWEVMGFISLALLLMWGVAATRSVHYLAVQRVLYLPVARYAYPMIIPTVLVLGVGWLEVSRLLGILLKRLGWQRLSGRLFPTLWAAAQSHIDFVVYLALFVSLDVMALISIARFYERF